MQAQPTSERKKKTLTLFNLDGYTCMYARPQNTKGKEAPLF